MMLYFLFGDLDAVTEFDDSGVEGLLGAEEDNLGWTVDSFDCGSDMSPTDLINSAISYGEYRTINLEEFTKLMNHEL